MFSFTTCPSNTSKLGQVAGTCARRSQRLIATALDSTSPASPTLPAQEIVCIVNVELLELVVLRFCPSAPHVRIVSEGRKEINSNKAARIGCSLRIIVL